VNFTVRPEIFEQFPEYIVGVVVLKGANNHAAPPVGVLQQACQAAAQAVGADPKNHPMVRLWRDAFTSVGYNPNKFPPSIDALSSRIAKTGAIPSINAAVDIINAHSLTYLLPMGAHDIGLLTGDFEVRQSKPGEIFTPMGSSESEVVPEAEYVYADDREVRTRRFIWRQGDRAKVTESTSMLFCPIDGFASVNKESVLAARASLAKMLPLHLGGSVSEYLVDRQNPSIPIA